MRVIIASFKILAFACLCIALALPQVFVLLITHGRVSRILPSLWMKGVVLIFNIRVRQEGIIHNDTQTLYVSNHLSYLDIPVLGSILPCSFVSKQDVARWPVFGFLANLGQTAYIGRSRQDLASASNTVGGFIARGESLVLFPEGTSTDGQEVLDFKSSLFSLVLGQTRTHDATSPTNTSAPVIQPVSLHVVSADQAPVVTQNDRDLYAWHRDMDDSLPTHLWRFAKTRGAEITVTFHPVLAPKDFSDRKTLAKACHKTVSNGLALLQKKSNTDSSYFEERN